jgi:hypothetical protein
MLNTAFALSTYHLSLRLLYSALGQNKHSATEAKNHRSTNFNLDSMFSRNSALDRQDHSIPDAKRSLVGTRPELHLLQKKTLV